MSAPLKRPVAPIAAFDDEVMAEFVALSTTCLAGAEMLLEELETDDPDVDERCGLLADRYEIYAIKLPGCGRLAMIVSLDTGVSAPWPCVVHGLVSSRGAACRVGKARAERHLGLADPSWEPADGEVEF